MADERRTQALRGPGAGGFVPAQSVAASNPCLNCGTNVQLDFCPECGQRQVDADPTLDEYVHEIAEEFLHWDGKLARTFRLLLTAPGALTQEYLEGRRIRYVTPLRVYLACSVLFFTLSAIIPARETVDARGNRVEAGVVQIGTSTPDELARMESSARASIGVRRVWLSHMSRALRTPRELQHATTASIPKGMFVLVPFFAALVGLVYRDRRRKYPQHLTFALHLHAVLFIVLSVSALTTFLPWEPVRIGAQALIFLPFAAYVARAAARVYNSSAAQARIRMLIASTLYLAVFVAVLACVFALTVLSY